MQVIFVSKVFMWEMFSFFDLHKNLYDVVAVLKVWMDSQGLCPGPYFHICFSF